ncbi:hypothetical protein OG206_00855 [Streptomyces sp. NBC_01341]|uniref:hypothetical protein n=1 Tax=Streptomyces sp. NBC_01341 TaxID=2903831 RepID=UPI002E10FC79|nr:hypothetical protein OG206_00855 [Streptomyces sp. NBC_01341]
MSSLLRESQLAHEANVVWLEALGSTTDRRGLCAELLAHVQAVQPDTGLLGSRSVRSYVAAPAVPTDPTAPGGAEGKA